jgi:predicted nucleic acid-binding protein
VNLVIADTSVWVAHFRLANPVLQSLVAMDQILCHPLIVIELACGTPPAPRERTLGDLRKLQQPVIATTDEILSLIENRRCYDTGCGAIDIALVASALLTRDARLWTMDKNLAALAARLGVDFNAASVEMLT